MGRVLRLRHLYRNFFEKFSKIFKKNFRIKFDFELCFRVPDTRTPIGPDTLTAAFWLFGQTGNDLFWRRHCRRCHPCPRPDEIFLKIFINFISSNSTTTFLTLTRPLALICLHSGGAAGLFRHGPVRSAFVVRLPEILNFFLKNFEFFFKFPYGTFSGPSSTSCLPSLAILSAMARSATKSCVRISAVFRTGNQSVFRKLYHKIFLKFFFEKFKLSNYTTSISSLSYFSPSLQFPLL